MTQRPLRAKAINASMMMDEDYGGCGGDDDVMMMMKLEMPLAVLFKQKEPSNVSHRHSDRSIRTRKEMGQWFEVKMKRTLVISQDRSERSH